MAKLIWSLEVKRSTSLNQRQVKRLLRGTCSLTITHPSGTSANTTIKQKTSQKNKYESTEKKKERKELAPTTCDGKFSLRIWGQTFIFIKVNLKVNRGVIIFLSSFICLSFRKNIKAFIMSRDRESCIFPPQEPEN